MSDLNYKNFELLDKSFRLGTTSFIFPDNIIPNVKKLGPYFDEIELLIFESHPKEVLPSKEDINELLHLSQRNNLTYNIHLPIDVSLTCDSLQKRIRAKDTLLKVMDLFTPLAPTTHTLHLEMPSETKIDMGNLTKLKKWKDNACQGVNALITEIADPSLISIETLDYPFSLIEPIVE
ncbi:MAG: sugar phosphate isomerase/epimerase, partial [Desulfobacteraceae bacterium]|nr:sugar phosphate isomerase/epimerase [Desulfobacteraceae bacterium]